MPRPNPPRRRPTVSSQKELLAKIDALGAQLKASRGELARVCALGLSALSAFETIRRADREFRVAHPGFLTLSGSDVATLSGSDVAAIAVRGRAK